MNRLAIALSLATCMVACLGNTTSLGGPEGNQASASSSQDAAPEADSPLVEGDAGDAADSADCFWYSFMPVAAAGACTYLLPSIPASDYSPYYDPRSPFWNPAKVFVETWFFVPPQSQRDWTRTNYVDGLASCPAEGGWYYDETSVDAQSLHTRYILCPTSCSRVNDGANFRYSATFCGER